MFGGAGEQSIEVLTLNSDNSFNITEYQNLTSYQLYPFAFNVAADDYLYWFWASIKLNIQNVLIASEIFHLTRSSFEQYCKMSVIDGQDLWFII